MTPERIAELRNLGVMVWIDGGICHAERRNRTDGSWSWAEVDGNTLNVEMFPVIAWRPLPDPPERTA